MEVLLRRATNIAEHNREKSGTVMKSTMGKALAYSLDRIEANNIVKSRYPEKYNKYISHLNK